MKKNVINLISFVRGANQRRGVDYMLEGIEKQLELFDEYDFQATVLIMYDALIEPKFTDVFKKYYNKNNTDLGLWFEIPKQLVDFAGIKWNGREGMTWDYYNNAGFLVSYTPEERKKLIDITFEYFKKIFGFYPGVVGSWHIDAFSLNYMREKYNISGACICRDQWGTDGYTLWGGYEPIYYPSKNNMFCPATKSENQIGVPVARMLGADPLYQFDIPYMRDKWDYCEDTIKGQITLEPTIFGDGIVRKYSGMNENWVRWYFGTMENELTGPIAYAQTGQENGFGWKNLGPGLQMQCNVLKEEIEKGNLSVEFFKSTCKDFSSKLKETPMSTVNVADDWMSHGRKAFWVYNKNYRSSVIFENNGAWIRELRLFADEYCEIHLDTPCRTTSIVYDNPPFIDGTLWSVNDNSEDVKILEQSGIKSQANASRAGLYFVSLNGNEYSKIYAEDIFVEKKDETAIVTVKCPNGDDIRIIYSQDDITVVCSKNQALLLVHNNVGDINAVGEDKINYIHRDFKYTLKFKDAIVTDRKDGTVLIKPTNGMIKLLLSDYK